MDFAILVVKLAKNFNLKLLSIGKVWGVFWSFGIGLSGVPVTICCQTC